MYQLSFYVPESNAEAVKAAVFETGAGRIGKYESCCWQTQGQGQFRPLAGSHPAIGKLEQLQTLAELKIELVCTDEIVRDAVLALKRSHPYEEVAYAVVKLANNDL
jgi:hypothetical protein